ncbi:MAG: DMT family transporter [Pseudomonadota bacterium]
MSATIRSSATAFDYALLLALATIWGGSFTLIAFTLEDFPPATMSMIRLFLGAALLCVIAVFMGERISLTGRTLLLLVLVGLFGNAIPFTLIAWGQQVVDAGLASILMGIMPIATLVLAHFFTDDEPLTKWKLIGVCVGLFGLVILVGPVVLGRLGDDGIRQIAILGAAISYGINAIITKSLLGLPRMAAGAGLVLAGAIWLVPIAFMLEDVTSITPSFESVWAIVLLAIFPTALAALLMFKIIDRQGAGFFGQINLLVPLAGVFWAYLFLSEALEPRAALALIIILSGVAVSRIRPSNAPNTRKEVTS